jgi:hypothetical protein
MSNVEILTLDIWIFIGNLELDIGNFFYIWWLLGLLSLIPASVILTNSAFL